MNPLRILVLAGAVVAGAASYARFARPKVLNWGATSEDVARTMPGDDILPDAAMQTTRCITIDATPDRIWPWLVQMGGGARAGAYTYDWIERRLGIDIKNSDRILPEFQKLEVGEFLALNDKGTGIEVREVVPNHHLVLQWAPTRSTWTFGLYPVSDGRTRLVSRNRLPRSGPLFWPMMLAFMEPGSLVMERKMLLGIKERVERSE